MGLWNNSAFSPTGNRYNMNNASVARMENIVHERDVRKAKRVFDPYAETQLSSVTVNKNFQNPLSISQNPNRSANPDWARTFNIQLQPTLRSGWNGNTSTAANPNVIPGAITKQTQNLLIDKQHVTAGTAVNNDFSTDLVTPKNFDVANGVKFTVGSPGKASAPTPDKFWAMNQNLYSPLVLDAKGQRTNDSMIIIDKNTNPSSQYLTQENQLIYPLPKYQAFEPIPQTQTLMDKLHSMPYASIYIAAAVVAGVVLLARRAR